MQSYRNRRTKPEPKCSRRTIHIQARQEPSVKKLSLFATSGPCQTSTNRVHSEKPEEFKLPIEMNTVVVAYMPSIRKRKSTSKHVAERKLPHIHSRSFRTAVKLISLTGTAAFFLEAALRDSSIHITITWRRQWHLRAFNAPSEDTD